LDAGGCLQLTFLVLTPLLSGTVTLNRLLNRVQQVLIIEGLGAELGGSGFHGADRHWNIVVAGHEDYRNTDISVEQLPL